MSLLPASMQAAIRQAVARSFTQTATPLTPGYTAQAGGGWDTTDAAGTPFPCRLTPIAREPVEGLVDATMESHPRYWLFYPVEGVTLAAEDTLLIDGLTYEIQAVLNPVGYAQEGKALVWHSSEVTT